ncbi:MAG TPA: RodZ domain-containing protein [Terriglobales bacterium]|nr:RodZ domain-containing protein [Terriglobales bacterium]
MPARPTEGYTLPSFGARLKQEREKRNLSLEDVSRSTKISVRMLQALEEEHFERLPGGVFNKGFVRAYARCLELSEDQAVADYLAATGPAPVPEQPQAVLATIAKQKARTQKPRLTGAERIPWGKVAIGLLVVAFGFAIWGSDRHTGTTTRAPTLAQAPGVMAPAAPVQPAPGQALSASVGDIGSETMQPAHVPGTFVVLIKAKDDCWLDISADGRDFMHDTLEAGHEKSVSARSEVVIKAGNAGGLELWFNGKQLTAPAESERVRTLIFRASGLQPFAAKIQPAAQTEPAAR